jgi:LPXTG-motif cell wall-anchored protein
MKKLILTLAVLVIGILGAGALHANKTSADVLRYKNGNSVIYGGAYNQAELNKMKPDARALYAQRGVSTDLSKAVEGTVKKNGTVTVGGKVVATGVKSVGRQDYTPDSKPLNAGGTRFYERSVTNSLDHDLAAYVFLDANGEFKNAIMKACGNPAWGDKVKPSYQCKALTVSKKSRTEFTFAASHAESNATLVKTTYVVTDASGKVVQNSTSNNFKTSKPGTYTVKAVLTYNVNGVIKTVTGDCVKKFTVEEEPTMKVCDIKAGKMITIKESQFDSKKHSKNIKDCKIQVCELKTGTIKTIWKYEYDSKKHSKELKDCDKMEVCVIADKTGKMITIKRHEFDASKHSTDVDDCVVPPVEEPPVEVPPTPEQPLPETGAAGTIGLITGVSALGAGGYHFFQRRRLNK